MRALSLRQAQTCEEAKHPRCRCRCHGAAHGASRGKPTNDGDALEPGTMDELQDYARPFFENLPEDDPHYIPPRTAKR